MRWEIKNSNLFGPILIDMSVNQVETLLGEKETVFKRTPSSQNEIFAYDKAGLHLEFDKNGLLSQINIFPKNEVFIGEIQLLGRAIEDVYMNLRDVGVETQRDSLGLWCNGRKVFLVEAEELVDAVQVFR